MTSSLSYRRACTVFEDYDEWTAVIERVREGLYEDIIHVVTKREKVQGSGRVCFSIILRFELLYVMTLLYVDGCADT